MPCRVLPVAITLVAMALMAATASAAPQWVHDSPVSEQSAGYLPCAGTSPDPITSLLPSIDYAEAFIDQSALPSAGGVQLVRVQWFGFGGDRCARQGGSGTVIEIVLPPGVELALGPENPALCGFSQVQDASVCPVLAAPGAYGGTVLADGRSGAAAPWPLSDAVNRTRLVVPVRLTRPVASFAKTAERRCTPLPCPPDQSNGRVQFAVRFVPGAGALPSAPLISTVGLLGGSGAPTLLARPAPSRVRQQTLRRGLALRVDAPAGAKVRAALTVGSRTVAATSRRARSAGTLSLRLRAGARAIRRLGRRTRAARLTVTVVPDGQSAQRQVVTVRITR